MRIGILKQRYVREGGGSERYTNGLIAELLRLGHEVKVFAHSGGRTAPHLPASRIRIHDVPVLGGPSFLRQWSFARACVKAIGQAPCDLIFSVERTIRQDIVRAGGGCHREYLRQCRRYFSAGKRLSLALNPLHPTLLRLERQTFAPQNTRTIIANSHRGKEEIVRHYQFPGARIEVIHNGTDCDRFRPHPRVDDGRVAVLFVGSGFERKGLGFAIRTIARLSASVELIVAGKGNIKAYTRLAAQCGVEDRLHFLGVQHRIEDVYAQGDILIHPAIYEPFSNACLEAMACGLPVVTSRTNGASEIIIPGRNGAVVESPDDIDGLAGAIELFANPKHLREAAIEARRTAEAFPMSLNVQQTLAVIERVIAQP